MEKNKRRSRVVAVRVTFNKPCSETHAANAVRSCVNGTFYPEAWETSDPGKFNIRSVKKLKKSEE